MPESGQIAEASVEGLAGAIANRRWLRCSRPFPHVVAHDVFAPEFYEALAAQVQGIVNRGLSDVPDRARLSRGMQGYDAYGIGVTPDLAPPLGTFASPAWRDLMCGLFAIGPTPYVFAGIHHHTPWSQGGFVHNDFNPLWFPRAQADTIAVPDPERCAFKTGEGTLGPEEKVETVRGAVVIFYLLNEGWRPGDGGETGLFSNRGDSHAEAAVRCAPIDNSLVAFECTPHSFHAFLENGRLPRTSIIMWVHRELEEAFELYGEERLERWES